ncbi:N-acetylglucosamine-specific PTS transporter subunit IIBC [Thorsellia kenyensis]|uniref:N-acetylglucosamine-specific PTS transporter subunit IIBC n=1 Tax=Thorsellia kenyensis TaxID=1549888 RepID=A0ABV6CE61_9GAMM
MGILKYFQRIGAALMVPVAVLPAAAILVGIGYWIDPNWGEKSASAALLIKSGGAILDNMPMLFAIGLAFGMSNDKHGSAALTGFVSFMVVLTLCSPETISQIIGIPSEEVPTAFKSINNQFVGILVGVISAALYNRFYEVQLPQAFSFFNGKRLVPIISSFVMIGLSFILMYVWPYIYDALVAFGNSIKDMGSVGAGVYAFFNRLLIPVGLHHALNSVFWFDVAGINDIKNFIDGQDAIDAGVAIVGVTGRYQAGFFPIMMFGLPGAALAMYHCARPENKTKIAGIFLAGGFASFFTGVTEPLEFAFMFVAPVLYVMHALLTGLSVFIAAHMEWMAGFGFSAGLVDMLLSARNPLGVKWYMLIVQGLAFFGIYYVLFRFMIKALNLLTPGREKESNSAKSSTKTTENLESLAIGYLNVAGGWDNVLAIDACITRLRLTVKDNSIIDEATAKELGASGVVRPGAGAVQIVVGMKAELIAGAMKKLPR